MNGGLKTKTAVITGAGSGLGFQITNSFSNQGANISAFDKEISQKLETERRIVFKGDVTSENDIKTCFQITKKKFGIPEILVTCAGVFGPSELIQSVDIEDWERVLRVNLTGTFLFIKYALPLMMEIGWGRIICFASTAGVLNPPGVSPYNVSKAGVISLIRTVSQEISAGNVCINAVCPGNTDTPMARSIERQSTTGKNGDRVIFHRNLRKTGLYHQPEDVLDLITFLASEESRYINGQFIQLTPTR